MELIVKSLQGSYLVSGLEEGTTIGELKRMLHQQHSQQVPEPEEQCLVYRHAVLTSADAALQHLGITHGEQLVMLPPRPAIKRPRAQTTPAADTAAIRAAITEEARSRGIEHTLKEERPPVARRGLRLPADLMGASNEQLLQLLQQAFDGQVPGVQLHVSGGGQPGGGEQEQEEDEGEGELQVPEPPADRISQLTDMGFSETLSRNALLLHRSNVQVALEWLLEHGDNPAAAEPPTQEQLRQIYGRRRGRGAGRPSMASVRPEVLLSQLTDMGFDAAAAEAVLSRVGPSLELAVQMLLGGSAGGAAAAAPAGGGSARASSGEAAAAAGGGGSSAGGSAGDPAGAAGAQGWGSQDGSSAQESPQAGDTGSEGGGGSRSARAASASGEAAASGSAASELAEGRRSAAPSEPADGADTGSAGDDDEQEVDDDEFEDGDGDEFEDDDEDEDEYYDGDDDALYVPIGGTMQLANLGSADIEQLLQGANLQELTMGNQLLLPGGMDASLAGPQSTLLRLLDSPAFLEQVAAGMQALQDGEEQQQQPDQQQRQEPDTGGGSGGSS